jgi:hypothetical protein
MSQADLVQDMSQALAAYGQRYGLPDSAQQLQGIAGSLFTVYSRTHNLALLAREVRRTIQAVLAEFDPKTGVNAVIDDTKQALAEQAHQWRQELETEVRGTLAAYIQNYSPILTADFLETAVTSLMPLLKQGQITRAEVESLIQLIADDLGTPLASTMGVHPEYIDLAKTLAISLSQQAMEQAVSETVVAYVKTFTPTLVEIGETLIEQALSAVLKNQVDFGFDVDLALMDRQLLINQVCFKLNIMEQLNLPSKSAQKLADDLHSEIERFTRERKEGLGNLDVTTGLTSHDGLSISSGWTAPRRGSPEKEETETE